MVNSETLDYFINSESDSSPLWSINYLFRSVNHNLIAQFQPQTRKEQFQVQTKRFYKSGSSQFFRTNLSEFKSLIEGNKSRLSRTLTAGWATIQGSTDLLNMNRKRNGNLTLSAGTTFNFRAFQWLLSLVRVKWKGEKEDVLNYGLLHPHRLVGRSSRRLSLAKRNIQLIILAKAPNWFSNISQFRLVGWASWQKKLKQSRMARD